MVITVSRNSWHYKVWKFTQDPFRLYDRWMGEPTADQLKNRAREPKAICGYFWTIVFSPWLCFMPLVAVPVLIAAVCVALAPFYGAYKAGEFIVRRVKERDHERMEQPPSMVLTAVKATKTRVCPRISVR